MYLSLALSVCLFLTMCPATGFSTGHRGCTLPRSGLFLRWFSVFLLYTLDQTMVHTCSKTLHASLTLTQWNEAAVLCPQLAATADIEVFPVSVYRVQSSMLMITT